MDVIKAMTEAVSEVNKEYRDRLYPKPEVSIENKTKQVLFEMFTENTGAHILDSGDYYGRGWERARKKGLEGLEKEPVVAAETWGEDDFLLSASTWHYLNHYLERTDNYENLLDKMLQYLIITEYEDLDGEGIILLQLHNGCDVRGGYTRPRVFQIADVCDFILAQYDIYAGCKKCEKSWWSDDAGQHWYNYNTSEEDFCIYTKEGRILHKGCDGEIEFFPRW